ncbi:unnamed protein product [Nippostrongylus brasiliensis]|uniref:Uncharacterized protein n=1 Tax=Nippostrongylus brasiliensis TaxID=27835 RepID=A0A0N4Y1N4_NIPBR|nr:unnamed protein product [Nippostrongylus brasiliensis]
MPEGSCKLDDAVIIWQPTITPPCCRIQRVDTFEAFVTLRYVLLLEHELAFEFNPDYEKTFQLVKNCNVSQSYLSTSNHNLAFPDIPSNLTLHDYIIRSTRNRQRRDVKAVTLADNRTSEYELISKLPRLVPQLFGSEEIPPFEQ